MLPENKVTLLSWGHKHKCLQKLMHRPSMDEGAYTYIMWLLGTGQTEEGSLLLTVPCCQSLGFFKRLGNQILIGNPWILKWWNISMPIYIYIYIHIYLYMFLLRVNSLQHCIKFYFSCLFTFHTHRFVEDMDSKNYFLLLFVYFIICIYLLIDFNMP